MSQAPSVGMSHHEATSGERAVQAQAPGEVFSTSPVSPAGPAVDLRPDAGQQSQEPAQEAVELRDGQEQEEPAMADGDQQQLSKQELESDSFRMFSFKVVQCTNPDETHDWTECPFAHVGEKANRRDPRLFRYTGISCPDYRKGACKRGSVCPYAHGVFEVWLHPSRYRTQLCNDGPNCSRQVCFFAHGSGELRQVAPENLPVLEAGSTDGSEASSDAPGPAAGPPSSSSSDSDSSSDSGSSTAAAASCKGPTSTGEVGVAAATAGGSGTGSLSTAPTASKLRQIKPASLQQKQQQSLDWATAFSDPQLFMSRQASTASSVGSGSHASGLGLASFSSLGSQASLALGAGTPGEWPQGSPASQAWHSRGQPAPAAGCCVCRWTLRWRQRPWRRAQASRRCRSSTPLAA